MLKTEPRTVLIDGVHHRLWLAAHENYRGGTHCGVEYARPGTRSAWAATLPVGTQDRGEVTCMTCIARMRED